MILFTTRFPEFPAQLVPRRAEADVTDGGCGGSAAGGAGSGQRTAMTTRHRLCCRVNGLQYVGSLPGLMQSIVAKCFAGEKDISSLGSPRAAQFAVRFSFSTGGTTSE